MRAFPTVAFSLLLSLTVACAKGEEGLGEGGSGRGGGVPVTEAASSGANGSTSTAGSTASTTTTTTSGGNAPTTCADANGMTGCCEGSTAYYCKANATTVTAQTCKSGETCGWKPGSNYDYYACVASPGGADPSGTNPIECK